MGASQSKQFTCTISSFYFKFKLQNQQLQIKGYNDSSLSTQTQIQSLKTVKNNQEKFNQLKFKNQEIYSITYTNFLLNLALHQRKFFKIDIEQLYDIMNQNYKYMQLKQNSKLKEKENLNLTNDFLEIREQQKNKQSYYRIPLCHTKSIVSKQKLDELPYSAIVKIISQFSHREITGSGVLISKNSILTVAHNVYNQKQAVKQNKIHIYSAKNQLLNVRAKIFRYCNEFFVSKNSQESFKYNLAIVQLYENQVMDKTNYLKIDLDFQINEKLLQKQMILIGNQNQGQITNNLCQQKILTFSMKQNQIFYYSNCTQEGMSGAPILFRNEQKNEYRIIGIHQGRYEKEEILSKGILYDKLSQAVKGLLFKILQKKKVPEGLQMIIPKKQILPKLPQLNFKKSIKQFSQQDFVSLNKLTPAKEKLRQSPILVLKSQIQQTDQKKNFKNSYNTLNKNENYENIQIQDKVQQNNDIPTREKQISIQQIKNTENISEKEKQLQKESLQTTARSTSRHQNQNEALSNENLGQNSQSQYYQNSQTNSIIYIKGHRKKSQNVNTAQQQKQEILQYYSKQIQFEIIINHFKNILENLSNPQSSFMGSMHLATRFIAISFVCLLFGIQTSIMSKISQQKKMKDYPSSYFKQVLDFIDKFKTKALQKITYFQQNYLKSPENSTIVLQTNSKQVDFIKKINNFHIQKQIMFKDIIRCEFATFLRQNIFQRTTIYYKQIHLDFLKKKKLLKNSFTQILKFVIQMLVLNYELLPITSLNVGDIDQINRNICFQIFQMMHISTSKISKFSSFNKDEQKNLILKLQKIIPKCLRFQKLWNQNEQNLKRRQTSYFGLKKINFFLQQFKTINKNGQKFIQNTKIKYQQDWLKILNIIISVLPSALI